MPEPRVPLVDLPADVVDRLAQMSEPPINLYRTLGNHPALLRAWIDFAWTLREGITPRTLRELMILRGAQLMNAEYEWHHHRRMATVSGVPAEKLEQLADWRASDLFDERERAALAYAEEINAGKVSDEAAAALARHFAPPEVVELTLTAAFYAMVPRVLDALRVPVES
jgi:4-carboxymuconolactone decarboxylase